MEGFDNKLVDLVPLRGFDYKGALNNLGGSLDYSRVWTISYGDEFKPQDSNSLLFSCLNDWISRKQISELASTYERKQFTPAWGVIPPGSVGYLSARPVGKSLPECMVPSKTTRSISLLYMEGLTRPEIVEQLVSALSTRGFVVKRTGLERLKVIERMLNRKYEIALTSFGLDNIPEMTLRQFYEEDGLVPFLSKSSQLPDSRFIAIDRTSDQAERHLRLTEFQSEVFRSGNLVPLMFERTYYLMNECLTINGLDTRTATEDFVKVGYKKECN